MKISAQTPQIAQNQPANAESPSGKRSFKSAMESDSVGDKVSNYVENVLQDEKRVDRALRRAMRGAEMSNAQLLETQALLYRYTQEVDLASKVVDKTANGFKQLMNIQV